MATAGRLDAANASRIRITIDGKPFTYTLLDNRTTRELIAAAPFSGSASVYHGNHYYLVTPKGLSVEGLKPTRDAKQGDLVYSAEYNGLGIFFADGHFDENELFFIGETDEGLSGLDTTKAVEIAVEALPNK